MKAIYLCLLLEIIVNPVKISVPTIEKGKKGEKKVSTEYLTEYLKRTISDTDYINLFEEIQTQLSDYAASNEEDNEEAFSEIILGILQGHPKIKEHHKEIASMFLLLNKRKTDYVFSTKKLLKGVDISGLDVDLIVQKHPFMGSLVAYSNTLCGAKTLQDFKKISDPYFKDLKKAMVDLKEFSEKSKGKLPSINSDDAHEKELARAIQSIKQEVRKKGI